MRERVLSAIQATDEASGRQGLLVTVAWEGDCQPSALLPVLREAAEAAGYRRHDFRWDGATQVGEEYHRNIWHFNRLRQPA